MGYSDINSYRTAAIHFANYIDRENCISFIDKKNSTHKFNKHTEEYFIENKKGYVITYYKLDNGLKRFYKEMKRRRLNNEKRKTRKENHNYKWEDQFKDE